MSDIHEKIKRHAIGAIRYTMVHYLSAELKLYVVNEYPKSGGTWFGQMLAQALDVPFPRNTFPVLRSSIMHGHYIDPKGMKNVVVVWRDGRDVMVSLYHHCLFKNERANADLVAATRKDLNFKDYLNVTDNLSSFIEYAFTRQRYPRFSWADFVTTWHGREGVTYVRYEDLRQRTASELQRVVFQLNGRILPQEKAQAIADEFSFARQSGRQPGQEKVGSFMRKGVVGDWRNVFNAEARKVFNDVAGKALIVAGYEKDSNWVFEE